jgi:16S rRNA G1207 methylase RsmC
VLEPSAGKGALAIAAAQRTKHVVCVEKNPVFAEYLRDKVGFPSVIEADFLEVHPGADLTKPHSIVGKFDRVVMNPPFSKGQEVRHVMHALQFLRPGGRLVSVMSAAVQFRQDGPYRAFRDMLDCAGDNEVRAAEIELLPANSFKESGTGVNTVLAIIDL